jgi:hypothetical protein
VGHAGIVHQPRGLQWPGPVAGEIEQPGSGSEQQVDEVNSHLVEEPRLQELTPEARTAMSTTSWPLAAVRACASTLSMPSETNVNVLPPGRPPGCT